MKVNTTGRDRRSAASAQATFERSFPADDTSRSRKARDETFEIVVGIIVAAAGFRVAMLFVDTGGWFIFFAGLLMASVGGGSLVEHWGRWVRSRDPTRRGFAMPKWLVVVAGLVAAGYAFGTPHISFMETRQGCLYLGWNGLEATPGDACVLLKLFPMKLEFSNSNGIDIGHRSLEQGQKIEKLASFNS